MADGMFSRLGRMVDSGLSKLEDAETKVLSGAESKLGHAFVQEAADARQKHIFSSGPLAKLEDATTKVFSGAESKLGHAFVQEAADARQKYLLAAAEIHGGESVHTVSKPNATPSVSHTGKGPKVREV